MWAVRVVLGLGLVWGATAALAGNDCNGNGVPDDVDIGHGVSEDCNANAVPDECDLTAGTSFDCNGNGIPDDCDTASTFTATALDTQIGWGIEVRAGDIDGDGDPDLAVNDETFNNPKAWYENVGSGSFVKRLIQENGQNGPIRLADLEPDGDLDIVTGYFFELVWFENTDGLGTFALPEVLVSGSPAFREMTTIDLDADGDDDIVVTRSDCAGTSRVEWYEKLDGMPAFGTAQVIYAAPFSCSSLLDAADVDGDGDGDVLLAEGTLVWFENTDGAGTFGAPRLIGEPAGWVRAADVDSDGDLDALTNFDWYENLDGVGNFGPARPVTTVYAWTDAADMDGDGDRDFLTGLWFTGDGLEWRENADGQGTLGETHPMFSGNISGYGPQVFDFDGDGDRDVVVSGSGGGPWLLANQSGDCDADGVPDVCQPDCNGSGIADRCDVLLGLSADCNGDLVPDECEVPCPGGCDGDADACIDALDCAPEDDTVWSEPSAARSLALHFPASGNLLWNPPAVAGGASVRYDTLRSDSPADFQGAVCVETDGADTASVDLDAPPTGEVYHYLIRVENDCPGGSGSMGVASDGTPRSGPSCR